MSVRRRWLVGCVSAFVLALMGFALALSYEAPCAPAEAAATERPAMKAVLARCYGSPEVLTTETIGRPTPADDEVLVRVKTTSLNPADWHSMRGEPYVMRLSEGFGTPTDFRVGKDFAGVVETVGSKVTRFKAGDEVFGIRSGSLAEYVVVSERRAIVVKPQHLSFEAAAAVGVAATTALQAVRDRAGIRAGQKILINGASGGVGTFAVQIAKAYGAEVTGVCSTRNVELVRSLGADHVIDYTQDDFTEGAERYDAVIDNVGNHSVLTLKRVLQPEGRLVIVGGPSEDPWIGALMGPIQAAVLSPFIQQQVGFFIAHTSLADLQQLSGLMTTGKVQPVVDKIYPFGAAAEAMRYLETGRARGKVIVRIE